MTRPFQSGQMSSPPPALLLHFGSGPKEISPEAPSGNSRRRFAGCASGFAVVWLLPIIS
jgi:hypothetical protein